MVLICGVYGGCGVHYVGRVVGMCVIVVLINGVDGDVRLRGLYGVFAGVKWCTLAIHVGWRVVGTAGIVVYTNVCIASYVDDGEVSVIVSDGGVGVNVVECGVVVDAYC